MPNPVELVKQAAVEAVEHTKPSDLLFGTVISISPLVVDVEQRMKLEEQCLVLSSLVQDFELEMTVDHEVEEAQEHVHSYKGRKKYKMHLALKAGEEVVLLRKKGGQKYLVLDRIRR